MPKNGHRAHKGHRSRKKKKKKKKNKPAPPAPPAPLAPLAPPMVRVFQDVNLVDAIMDFYFVANPERGASVSPLGMTSAYWFSCHDHCLAKNRTALARAWYETCCDEEGFFTFNRTKRARKLYPALRQGCPPESALAHLLRGCRSSCFGSETGRAFGGSADSDSNLMSLVRILSSPSLKEDRMALSSAQHLMSQWMFCSIGDWNAEMKHASEFKENLLQMCVGWSSAKKGGCRPAERTLRRGRAMYKLALNLETRDLENVRDTVNRLRTR